MTDILDVVYLCTQKKAFDTVDHKILLPKLDHYGIWGISSNWLKFYLINRKQLCSTNDCVSELAETNSVVPQGPVPGPLLFFLNINGLNQAMKFCKLNHFSDGTNLTYLVKSVKKNLTKL